MVPDAQELLTANLPLVERAVAFACRRYRLQPEEAEEITSVVHLKLVENDYAVLRSYEGRSSLATFISVVVQRLVLDHRIILGATDIGQLPLREHSPLIVLSACGTLRGETTHIAGMPSLGRAFLAAGARAVVGTLWEIDDDRLSPVFIAFHRYLRAGLATPRALQLAQIDMLRSSDAHLNHPSIWSPVEVLSNL